jgi:hypothetical protein
MYFWLLWNPKDMRIDEFREIIDACEKGLVCHRWAIGARDDFRLDDVALLYRSGVLKPNGIVGIGRCARLPYEGPSRKNDGKTKRYIDVN